MKYRAIVQAPGRDGLGPMGWPGILGWDGLGGIAWENSSAPGY
jgi:hypothetical protein